jgi:hypothetical protein
LFLINGITCLLLTSPLLLHAALDSATPQVCETTHDINRVSIRHIESKGIGYEKGYTTLEAFFVPLSNLTTDWIPFLDLRGHIFNNSQPAANAGMGLRYIDARVWGANIYYDYRKTSERSYNQISFGFESLGRYLDYRINGYFPVGKHKGSLSDARFDHFSGHSLYIARKQELALKGTNGEVGVHIAKVKGIDFYSALGPYYFTNDTKQTFGGAFRIGMDVLKILRIEGNTSYDHLFRWIGQGQISLSYAFTPKKISRKEKKGSCSYHAFVRDRAFQRVDKQEIIVTTTQKKKSVAINPETGLPYVFWFVDNTSNSQGTYESPYSTLANAETNSQVNDIIAVLPGDGTDRGMNAGITLKNGQKLWGMSIIHTLPTTLGNIKIKPLTSIIPLLTNSGTVVTCGNNNDVIGLKLRSFGNGNKVIEIDQKNGNFNIENNIIYTPSNGVGIYQYLGDVNSHFYNNTIIGEDNNGSFGIYIASSKSDIKIIKNTITTNNGMYITSSLNNKSIYIEGNTINNSGFSSFGIGIYSQKGAYLISGNMSKSPINIVVVGGGDFAGTLRNNQVSTLDRTNTASYIFQGQNGASASQINFAPDNIGDTSYSGF